MGCGAKERVTTQLKKQSSRFAYFPEAQHLDLFPLFIALIAVLSYGKILFLRDVFWDDNCWLLSTYASSNLNEFLSTGFYELRRVPMGTFLYYLLSLHKHTDYAYQVWHLINITVQVLTPTFLYFFLKDILNGKRLLPFFAAISLIAFPLDYTLPYLTVISYRIATMLSVISFYFTVKAFISNKRRWFFLTLALLTSGISYYVFMEATVVFEPARLFVIGYIFYSKGIEHGVLVKKTIIFWSLFLLLSIPLIIYKLTVKPYGIYEGTFKSDYLFFLNWREHAKVIRTLLLHQWRILFEYISDVKIGSILLSMLSVIMSFFSLKKIFAITETEQELNGGQFKQIQIVLFLGLILLIPQVMLLEFARREIGSGMNSSHFNQMQIGYAVILGALIYFIFISFFKFRKQLFLFFLSFAVSAGVFFNNLNLDVYVNSWEKQTQFWKSFTKRFPSLPENATFMMDVRDFYYFDATDLDNAYDLEPALNLLYNSSDDPKKFRRYKVFAMEEFKPEMTEKFRCNQMNEEKMERMSHFGKEALNPCEFVVVRYRDNELLVNDEIVERYPDIPYKNWANKKISQLPEPTAYPLRYKLKGYY